MLGISRVRFFKASHHLIQLELFTTSISYFLWTVWRKLPCRHNSLTSVQGSSACSVCVLYEKCLLHDWRNPNGHKMGSVHTEERWLWALVAHKQSNTCDWLNRYWVKHSEKAWFENSLVNPSDGENCPFISRTLSGLLPQSPPAH